MPKSAAEARWKPIVKWVILAPIPVIAFAVGFLVALYSYALLGEQFGRLFGGAIACLLTALGIVAMVQVEKLLTRKGF